MELDSVYIVLPDTIYQVWMMVMFGLMVLSIWSDRYTRKRRKEELEKLKELNDYLQSVKEDHKKHSS